MNDVLSMIITALCFAVLSGEFVRGIVKVLFKGRQKRVEFLRSFKKGRFAVIYATAFPLCLLGHIHIGEKGLEAAFGALSEIFDIVVLKYDFIGVKALVAEDNFYRVTFYFCYVMAFLNVVLFTVSLANQKIWEFRQSARIRYCPKDRLFIFGANPQNVDIYNSDKERCKIIADKLSEKDEEEYYLKNISYLSNEPDEDVVAEIFKNREFLFQKLCVAFKGKKCTRTNVVVINTGSDERNMHICRLITERISACTESDKEKIFRTFKVFVFGSLEYEGVYEDIEADGCGCITYVNKYKKIGADFAEKYPLAKFMDEKQIDYETSLIKKDVNINFFMICFGKVGRQIFLTSISNNQFLAEGENGPELKKVNYHIFDKEIARNNKNFNHSYYRYRNEILNNNNCDPKDFLPFPSLPAEENYYHFDINDGKLYTELEKCVQGKNDANFVLISFGNDLENIDMAQKLVAKRREWGKNLVIFVRAHKRTKEQAALEEDGCIFIGDETEIVYNIDKILSDKMQKIAIMRNEDYDLENAIGKAKKDNPNFEPTDEFIQEKKYESFKKWHMKIHRLMRDSNIYAAMSIRAKLNLMGLDYCEIGANDEPAVTEKEYLEIYAAGDMPKYTGKTAVGGRKIIEYDIDFLKSRRWNMAVLEHYRWNSYLISKGFVPATIKQIKEETVDKDGKTVFTNGRSYIMRRHGNLTTFEGLEIYRKMVAKRDGANEKDTDVIKYDYQILDDIYYFLTEGGYKIIRKK